MLVYLPSMREVCHKIYPGFISRRRQSCCCDESPVSCVSDARMRSCSHPQTHVRSIWEVVVDSTVSARPCENTPLELLNRILSDCDSKFLRLRVTRPLSVSRSCQPTSAVAASVGASLAGGWLWPTTCVCHPEKVRLPWEGLHFTTEPHSEFP